MRVSVAYIIDIPDGRRDGTLHHVNVRAIEYGGADRVTEELNFYGQRVLVARI